MSEAPVEIWCGIASQIDDPVSMTRLRGVSTTFKDVVDTYVGFSKPTKSLYNSLKDAATGKKVTALRLYMAIYDKKRSNYRRAYDYLNLATYFSPTAEIYDILVTAAMQATLLTYISKPNCNMCTARHNQIKNVGDCIPFLNGICKFCAYNLDPEHSA